MSNETTRRVFAVMAFAETTGAATTCVGVLGIEPDGAGWRSHVEWADELVMRGAGGWPERIEAAGEITPDIVDRWCEDANGVSWELSEIEPWEYEGHATIESAIGAVLEDILANPDPPAAELDARRPIT